MGRTENSTERLQASRGHRHWAKEIRPSQTLFGVSGEVRSKNNLTEPALLEMSGNATSMIGLCQEGKSSPDALGRSAGVNSFGFFAAHLGLSPCGSFVEEEPDFHLLAQL
jgi:hypothetical protein